MAQGGQARLREALQAGGPGSQKEKGPPIADGILTVTPDTPEAVEWRSRRSVIDSAGASSSYLEDESGEGASARLLEPWANPKGGWQLMGCRARRPQALRAVWQVHLEDRELFGDQQARAAQHGVRGGQLQVVRARPRRMAPRHTRPAALLPRIAG